MNTGSEPFVFFAAWPGDSGHDYGAIEKVGFAKIMVERNGGSLSSTIPSGPHPEQECISLFDVTKPVFDALAAIPDPVHSV